jgi:hypothetical protein
MAFPKIENVNVSGSSVNAFWRSANALKIAADHACTRPPEMGNFQITLLKFRSPYRELSVPAAQGESKP